MIPRTFPLKSLPDPMLEIVSLMDLLDTMGMGSYTCKVGSSLILVV